LKNNLKYLALLIIILSFTQIVKSQNIDFNLDSNFVQVDSLQISDAVQDTFPKTDTLSLKPVKHDDPITEIINYSGLDSMMLSMQDKVVYLYGSGFLSTSTMELNAGRIQIDMTKSELYAHGYEDTTGTTIEKPVFKDGDQTFSSSSMKYNFKTQKGIIKDVKTEQADGFLHGTLTKIQPNKEVHILHGKFTTCDADHPHFYIELTKAKVIPQKRIIAGPLYFVILDVPLYAVGLPFGFFPTKKKKASGLLMPSYKNEKQRGFGITNGGYYFALNDYYDLTVLGDIYSSGSWGASAATTFKKRYKYSGKAFFQYSKTRYEEIMIPDSLKEKQDIQSFKITLSYAQDTKKNPTSNFSANVNLDLGGFSKINAETINEYVNTTTSTSISYQKTFPETPFNLSISANAVQNLSSKTIDLKLPSMSLNMNRIYPFKGKLKTGIWYEDIGLAITSNFDNSLFTNDSLLKANPKLALSQMEYGYKYSAPLSTSFNILKFVTCNPSLSYSGRVYPNYVNKKYVTDSKGLDSLVTDTIFGIRHNLDFSLSVPFSTKLYGLVEIEDMKFKPLKNLLENIGLIAFRHVMSPSLGYSYKPDFSNDFWNYYEYTPDSIPYKTDVYSIFENGIFGYSSAGEQQNLNFSLGNNFEMKVRNAKDTVTNEKKIKILDNLSFSSAYNFAADSLNLSAISMRGSTTIFDKTSVNFGATLDPYAIDKVTGQRINTFEIIENKNLLRFTTGNISLNTSFDQNTISDFFNYKKEDFYDEGYSYYNVPWSVSGSYIFSYSKGYDKITQKNIITASQNLTFSMQLTPTPLWSISVGSGYDLDAQELTMTNIAISRSLHCWTMNFSCVPFGSMKNYMFSLGINAALFQSVKYKRENYWQDNF